MIYTVLFMDIDKPLSELSHAEFLELLRSRRRERSWTVGQLSEYERRGPDFLVQDSGLRDEIDQVLEDYYERLRESFEPLQKYWKNLLPDSFGDSLVVPKLGISNLTITNLLDKNPVLASEPLHSDLVRNEEKAEVESSFTVLHELLGSFRNVEENTRKVEVNTKWGLGQWALLFFAFWAAVASTFSAFS